MKNILLISIVSITVFFAPILSIEAQMLRELIREPVQEQTAQVFLESCNSPGLGILVFRTAITNLNISINPPSRLVATNYISEMNEYVLCLQPTNMRTRVTITHREYEAHIFFVDDIFASHANIFRLNPSQQPVVSEVASSNFYSGVQSMNNGDFAGAETFFRLAVDESPDNAEFLVNLSRAHFQQEKYVQAVNTLRRATNIRPNNAEIHHMLGNAYFAQASYENAAESFSNAVDLAPDNARYRSDLQLALNANPASAAGAHAERGNRFMREGNFDEALHSFRDAVAADPRNGDYQASVRDAEIRIRQQRYINAAANAYRAAERERKRQRTVTNKDGTTRTASGMTKETLPMYRIPLDEIKKAEDLGRGLSPRLTQEWQNLEKFYKSEYRKYKSWNTWKYILAGIGLGGIYAAGEAGLLDD